MALYAWRVLLITGFLGVALQVPTGAQTSKEPEDVYEFPVQLESWHVPPPADKHAALQLPDSVRQSISTAGLLETCLRFPGLNFIATGMSDSTHRNIVARYEDVFNGFTELVARPDAAQVILARYLRSGGESDPQTTKETLEYLLRDSRVLTKLPRADVVMLLCECSRRHREGPGHATRATSLLATELLRRLEVLIEKPLGVPCDLAAPCNPTSLFAAVHAALAVVGERCE